jgi:hypothetical protein
MNKMFRGFLTEQPLLNADTGASEGGTSTGDVGNVSTEQGTPASTITNPIGVDTQPSNSTVSNEIEIEGFGKVKIDELKEWKSGYMRQSDYTRKTQELAKSRNEQKEALEIYNYLKNNPQVAQAISQGDVSAVQNNPMFSGLNPYSSQIEDLNMKLAGIELDNMISGLKNRYNDFNEVEVLQEADRLGVTDLEFVYNALQGKKLPTLKEQLTKEIERSITDKIKQNGLGTQSIINTNDASAVAGNGLSDIEVAIAKKMGLSPEAYAKGKK